MEKGKGVLNLKLIVRKNNNHFKSSRILRNAHACAPHLKKKTILALTMKTHSKLSNIRLFIGAQSTQKTVLPITNFMLNSRQGQPHSNTDHPEVFGRATSYFLTRRYSLVSYLKQKRELLKHLPENLFRSPSLVTWNRCTVLALVTRDNYSFSSGICHLFVVSE